MLRIILLLLIVGIVNMESPLAGDNTTVAGKIDTREIDAKEDDAQDQKPDDNSNAEKTPEELTPDTFDPTEKLSEDNPVSFPVDI